VRYFILFRLIKNSSFYYPCLLSSQALTRLLYLHDSTTLDVPKNLLSAITTLFHILLRILEGQNFDGSWGSREETAYAVIALANISSLPFVVSITAQVKLAIQRGRKYLQSIAGMQARLTMKDFIWVGKVSYAVENVCHSYILAALSTPVPRYAATMLPIDLPLQRVNSFAKFYSKLPSLASVESWKLEGWIMEGYMLLPELKKARLEVFNTGEGGEYLEYLPFLWIAASRLGSLHVSSQVLFDLMILSMLIFEVDDLFDQGIAREDLPRILLWRSTIEKLLCNISTIETVDEHDRLIYRQLQAAIQLIINHPRIQNASKDDKTQLQHELKTYLLAHVQQCEDNFKFRQQDQKSYSTLPVSYQRWVRTTASDHLGCQYMFAFMICLLGKNQDYIPDSEIKYIAQDCCAHLSVMSRMFNDYASVERDRKESNLNSLFFPEFDAKGIGGDFLKLAEYEKKYLLLKYEDLKSICGDGHRNVYDVAWMFYNATELHNEIYKLRDMRS
jgi:hypothetical protein